MELKDYTTEELRQELKRRAEIVRKEREKSLRCRNCVFFGVVDYWGNKKTPTTWESNQSCPFHKTKNNKYYRCHNKSDVACEHFKSKYDL